MTQRHYTDRSRIETKQRCARMRWLEYHELVRGIVPVKKPLPLAVGGSVHVGLEQLLREGQALYNLIDRDSLCWADTRWRDIEELAVASALADFSHYTTAGLELDLTETTALGAMAGADGADTFTQELQAQARQLGMSEAEVAELAIAGQERRREALGAFDRYLAEEQAALVEALVRAYARRRLRPLLEQYEVLEVEREGQWKLSEWPGNGRMVCEGCSRPLDTIPESGCPCGSNAIRLEPAVEELWFMSRPDALLRDRQDNQLYLLSFKTTGAWDMRKEKDAQRDMQGLSEGVEVERRLAAWWQLIHSRHGLTPYECIARDGGTSAMAQYLYNQPTPPRVLGIRYEYLLKGERWKDKDLSARLGVDARSQRTHLLRQYVATSTPKKGEAGYAVGDVCWSWDYVKEDASKGTLAWANWKSRAAWEGGGTKAWIDLLDATTDTMSGYDSTTGLEPRRLGWGGPAQRVGYTDVHPLDAVFPPPMIVYRGEDELRDWVEQVASQEREVAERVAEVRAAADEGEKRSLLNRYFPQTRRACEYPGTCAYTRVCWGGEDLRSDPVTSGLYRERTPNHPQEIVDSEEK